MSGLIFWDVDTQVDFMHPDGKLYVPEAEQLVANLKALSDFAHARGIRVVASADDHIAGDPELSDHPDFVETFPPHCMRSTKGQKKIPETALEAALVIDPVPVDPQTLKDRVRKHGGDILFNKNRFDVFTNPNVEPVLEVLDPDEIVVYGVALDVCNRYAIEGLLGRRPQTKVFVVTDASKPIATDKKDALLDDWVQRGAALVTTAQALQLSENRMAAEVPHRV